MPCAACRAMPACSPTTAPAWPCWANATRRAKPSMRRWPPIPTMPRRWRPGQAWTHEQVLMSGGADRPAADRLVEVRQRIAAAARAAGRDPASVTLVAVSKTHGAERVRELLEAGQRVFGENRVQEAEEKFPALKTAYPDIELHLIGPLQT